MERIEEFRCPHGMTFSHLLIKLKLLDLSCLVSPHQSLYS